MLLVIKDIRLGLLSVGMFTFYFNIIRSTGDYFANVLNTFVSIGEQSLYIDNFKTLVELPNIIKPGKIKKVNKLPKIEFVKVWFKYPGSTKYVFKNLNLVIEKGEEIAIVGHNGAGKSTLIKLLCRFYDPNKGQILIDGVDLKKLDINSWYDKLSLLTQEFNTYENLDLKENVAIGNKINKKRIITSLKRSDAWEFVGNYKNGLDTMMSQRYGGAEPSWGQWQKIAIARLFYSNKDIMVLDEPTSSIDAISEAKIFNRLYKQVSGKTLIIVSHRFSTVRNAKRIIVLNKGEIVEIGSHEELVKLNGYYNKSFNLQAKGYK